MKIDRGHVAQGLMGPMEVVFHQPFSEIGIEPLAVSRQVTQLYELLSQGAIESLIHRIVRWGLGTRKVVRQLQHRSRHLKVLGKLRSIVSLNVFNLSGKQVVQSFQKISGIAGVLGGIHTSKRDLGVDVNAGKDISLGAVPVDRQAVKRYQKAVALFFLEFRDALPGLITLAFLPQAFRLFWMIIQLMLLNDSLDLPGRDNLSVRFPIQNGELLLAVADVAPPQDQDTQFLFSRYLPLAGTMRSATQFFQRLKTMRIIPLLPLMECLARDAEVPARLTDILNPMMIVHPREAHPCFSGQYGSGTQRSYSFGEDICCIHTSPIVLTQAIPARHR